jgi:hypothetical protein
VLLATLQTYVTQVQRLLHDATNANFSNQEIIDRVNEAREDVALDMRCVRSFRTGVQAIPGVETYQLSGAVVGATITAGGGTYTGTPPTVTFSAAPAGGVTATGTAQLDTAGQNVIAINMTAWGQGYLTAPTITFGSGTAAATANFFANVFQINAISNVWNNQRYTLDFRGFGLFQAYFRAWTTIFQSRPGVWTIHPETLNVFLRPPPDQIYFMEWDVMSLPLPLVNLTDIDKEVVTPWNKAVQFRATALCLMKNQNFDQAQYYEEKYEQRVPRIIMGQGGIRIPNPYNRTFQRRVSRG